MDHADVDHDGKIDCGEFANWATGVAAEIAASGTIPQHLLGFFKASFSNSDQNGDGEVDRDEFIALQSSGMCPRTRLAWDSTSSPTTEPLRSLRTPGWSFPRSS